MMVLRLGQGLQRAVREITDRRSDALHMVAMLVGGAVLGKVFGVVRELLIARTLGATLIADSFRGAIAAVQLPILPMQMETVPAVLVPLHRDWQIRKCAGERHTGLCVALTLATIQVTILVEVFCGWWVSLVVGGMSQEGQQLTVDFVRIMALAMPASVLINCLAAGEIATGQSRIFALTGAFLNLALIIGISLYAMTGNARCMPIAFAIYFQAIAVWCIWQQWKEGRLELSGTRPAVVWAASLEFLHCMRPFVGLPALQLAQMWIERRLASQSVVGTLASLDYARALTDSALYLIGQPLGLAVLAKQKSADLRAPMLTISRPVLAVTIPLSLYLSIFSPDIVRFVFQRGAFDENAALLTGNIVRGITMGLWASTLGLILLRLLNGAGKSWQAALALACSFAANGLVNLISTFLAPNPQNVALMLGVGEAVRGMTLLAGVCLILGCCHQLFVMLAKSIPAALLFVLAAFGIAHVTTSPLLHILFGGAACLTAIVVSAWILLHSELAMLQGRMTALMHDEKM